MENATWDWTFLPFGNRWNAALQRSWPPPTRIVIFDPRTTCCRRLPWIPNPRAGRTRKTFCPMRINPHERRSESSASLLRPRSLVPAAERGLISSHGVAVAHFRAPLSADDGRRLGGGSTHRHDFVAARLGIGLRRSACPSSRRLSQTNPRSPAFAGRSIQSPTPRPGPHPHCRGNRQRPALSQCQGGIAPGTSRNRRGGQTDSLQLT